MKLNGYQIVCESSDQSIVNNVKKKIKEKFGYDVSKVPVIFKAGAYYNNGKPSPMPLNTVAGQWTKNGVIMAPKEQMLATMKHFKVKDTYEKFRDFLIAHELSHEIWKRQLSLEEQNKYTEQLKNFRTPYTDTNNTPQERFCEYIPTKIYGPLKV